LPGEDEKKVAVLQDLNWRLQAMALKGLFAFLRLLGVERASAFGGKLLRVLGPLTGTHRTVTRNLRIAFPDMDPAEREHLVGQSLRDIGKSLTESACAWIWPAQRSIDLVREVEGLDVLKDALASGKGVVGITSHLGNWEVLNHFYCSQCKPIIFYRPPKLKAVDELLQKQRVQLGNKVAASTKEGILSVIKEVRRGGAVGIPADPEPAESAGIFVPFFAVQALTSKFVPNMLAGGKAVGVFLHALRLPDGSGYKVILEAAPEAMYSTDTATSCAAMSQVVERYVRAYPSQYMWSMKRFKKRPAGEERWY
jgi:KDO2-lipid IV(A) lauroyltransferase